MNNLGSRLKNKVTLLALLAWIYSVLEMSGVINVLPSNFWDVVVLGGVNILVVLGFVNDPSDPDKHLK